MIYLMRSLHALFVASLVLVFAGTVAAADLSGITSKEAVTALRTTLSKGADVAVGSLGKTDGFWATRPCESSCRSTWKTARVC